jgi:addiction module HigA family antidote
MKKMIQNTSTPKKPSIKLRQLMTTHNITVVQLAKALNLGRPHVSNLVNGKAGYSLDTGLKLSKVFGTKLEYWVNLQYDFEKYVASERLYLEDIQCLIKVKG